jgi:hypothetical protein
LDFEYFTLNVERRERFSLDSRRREQKMSESDKPIDWSKTTFEGSRREQLRRWAQLPLENILLAIEEMQEIADQLGTTRAGGSGESAGVKITAGTISPQTQWQIQKKKDRDPMCQKILFDRDLICHFHVVSSRA